MDVSNLVVVSDLHVGDALGLCDAGGHDRDEGGRYMPSPLQIKLWWLWREFWDTFVPEATKGEPFAVLVNGDALDGPGVKRATHQWTHNLGDQGKAAQQILAPVVEQCNGRFYVVRGTEAHVGSSAVEEERLAASLGAIQNAQGQHSRFEFWANIGPALVHALHHIGTTGSQHYESTAVHKEMVEEITEAGRWGREFPDVVIRSHRHRHIETVIPTHKGRCFAVVTPAWQLKTPFAFRVPGARLSEPQIGGLVVRHAHGETFVRPKVWSLEREEPE